MKADKIYSLLDKYYNAQASDKEIILLKWIFHEGNLPPMFDADKSWFLYLHKAKNEMEGTIDYTRLFESATKKQKKSKPLNLNSILLNLYSFI